jgi:hypothetical protein
VLFLGGCAIAVLNMLLYPYRSGLAPERLRFWLDAGTVLAGGERAGLELSPSTRRSRNWLATVAAASVVPGRRVSPP